MNDSRWAAWGVPVVAALALAGCAPPYDWRQVRPQGSQIELDFPCKPSTRTRLVQLAGQPVSLALYACTAAGQTWGLAFGELADPLGVPAALDDLVRSAGANIDAGEVRRWQAVQVAGATPQAASRRVWFTGKLPDGSAVNMQVAVFTYGSRVFQASALGASLPQDAAQTFFDSIRVKP